MPSIKQFSENGPVGVPKRCCTTAGAHIKLWLDARLGEVSQKSGLAEAIRYALSHWEGLTRFLSDGRIEIDSNTVERTMRPIALGRRNYLFAGSD